jgi:multidrug resistance efflux pump
MAFVNTDPKDKQLTGAWQNSLQRVRSGDKAEVAFDAVPGRVFKGKAGTVIGAIPSGQMQPSGTMLDAGDIPRGGRALAQIDLTDDVNDYNIPLGAVCEIAIYTDHFEGLSLLRKILLRMRSWQKYVFTEEGHEGGGHGGH